MELNHQRVLQSSVVLANAAELAANVISSVAGNDISDTLGGSKITRATLRNIAVARFKRRLLLGSN